MHKEKTLFRIGACGSENCKVPTERVQKLLKKKFPTLSFESVFFASLEELGKALRSEKIDFALYTQTDLPLKDTKGFTTGAVLKRENLGEVLLSREGHTLESLPEGSKVATMTSRQKGQLLFARKDLMVSDLRENGSLDGFDAVVVELCEAKRRDCEDLISEVLGFDFMLPYPGQGAIAIQCKDDERLIDILAAVNDEKTFLATLGERSYLAGLGEGADLPVAAFGQVSRKMLTLAGAVIAIDGSEKHLLQVTIDLPAEVKEARKAVVVLGQKLARVALEDGASKLLESAA